MTQAESPLLQLAQGRIGAVVDGRWKLESVLGVGGMATVFGARHRNGKRVAIKLLHPHLALMPQAVTRFVREGYAANLVEHPGAVSVLDDGAMDGVPFLVMEYLEGETADARCDRLSGKLALADALAVADSLLAVLEAAHARGMVHRDVKPENVFLTSDGDVKLLDFGVARLAEVVGTSDSATQSGSSLGTPAFMPPEQARGDKARIDARTDLWAVGASLVYLISGRFVHEGNTINELLVKSMTKPARSLATIARGVAAPIVAVVDRALAFEPEDRWASAREMREALRAASSESGISVPARPSLAGYVPPPPPPRSSFASATSVASREERHVVVARPPGAAAPAQSRAAPAPDEDVIATRLSPDAVTHVTHPHEEPPVTTGTFPPPARPSRRGAWLALGAVGLLVLSGIAVVALRGGDPERRDAAAAVAAPPSASSDAVVPSRVEPKAQGDTPGVSPDSLPTASTAPGKPARPGAAVATTPPVRTAPAPAQPSPKPAAGGQRDIGDSRN